MAIVFPVPYCEMERSQIGLNHEMRILMLLWDALKWMRIRIQERRYCLALDADVRIPLKAIKSEILPNREVKTVV